MKLTNAVRFVTAVLIIRAYGKATVVKLWFADYTKTEKIIIIKIIFISTFGSKRFTTFFSITNDRTCGKGATELSKYATATPVLRRISRAELLVN